MNFDTNRNSVIRMVMSALTVINMTIVVFGGEQIAIADDKLYVVASWIALVVTVAIAIYKHNATSTLGVVIRYAYDLAKKYSASEICEAIIVALEDFVAGKEEIDEEGEE